MSWSGTVGLRAILLCLILMSGLLRNTRAQEADEKREKPLRVAVLDFEAPAHSAWLGAAVGEALQAKLAGLDDVVLLERERIDAILAVKEGRREELSPALLGADVLIVGSVQVAQSEGINGSSAELNPESPLRISAQLIAADSARLEGTGAVVLDGRLGEIFALETRLARALAEAMACPPTVHELDYRETANLSALRFFAAGLVRLRQGRRALSPTLSQAQRLRAAGLFEAAAKAFRCAQEKNKGGYHSRAHRYETTARELLAKNQIHEDDARRVRRETVQQFRKDAAEAAPAFFDLGEALLCSGQIEAADRAYGKYLDWMATRNRHVRWEHSIVAQDGHNQVRRLGFVYDKPLARRDFGNLPGQPCYSLGEAGLLVFPVRRTLEEKLPPDASEAMRHAAAQSDPNDRLAVWEDWRIRRIDSNGTLAWEVAWPYPVRVWGPDASNPKMGCVADNGTVLVLQMDDDVAAFSLETGEWLAGASILPERTPSTDVRQRAERSTLQKSLAIPPGDDEHVILYDWKHDCMSVRTLPNLRPLWSHTIRSGLTGARTCVVTASQVIWVDGYGNFHARTIRAGAEEWGVAATQIRSLLKRVFRADHEIYRLPCLWWPDAHGGAWLLIRKHEKHISVYHLAPPRWHPRPADNLDAVLSNDGLLPVWNAPDFRSEGPIPSLGAREHDGSPTAANRDPGSGQRVMLKILCHDKRSNMARMLPLSSALLPRFDPLHTPRRHGQLQPDFHFAAGVSPFVWRTQMAFVPGASGRRVRVHCWKMEKAQTPLLWSCEQFGDASFLPGGLGGDALFRFSRNRRNEEVIACMQPAANTRIPMCRGRSA